MLKSELDIPKATASVLRTSSSFIAFMYTLIYVHIQKCAYANIMLTAMRGTHFGVAASASESQMSITVILRFTFESASFACTSQVVKALPSKHMHIYIYVTYNNTYVYE
jgi:hypothetical protein